MMNSIPYDILKLLRGRVAEATVGPYTFRGRIVNAWYDASANGNFRIALKDRRGQVKHFDSTHVDGKDVPIPAKQPAA